MYKKACVKRFNQDLEYLLEIGSLPESKETAPTEVVEMLALAERLSASDFSSDSQIRYSLRRRLLSRIHAREGLYIKEKTIMETLFARRPVTVTLPIVLLVSLVILTLAWPEGVKAAFQGVATFAQRIWVGEFTAVEPIDPDRITVLEDGRLMMPGTRVDEEITAADQVVGQGGWRHEISVQRFGTITAAREAVAFPLLQPAYLPAGYALSGANVWGSGANAYVFFNYEGADGKIGLSQRPVGGAGGQTVSIGLPDDYVIEKVVLNGIEALWAEHVLLWEVDGISYLVSSPDISQEEIIRIAESLE